ncbi:MAG: hypothetical protein GKR94_02125 [Gammaproteobacteria bacterium]|nr:hypothetical protein [Gammaproteobacteria bacterium]
MTNLIHLDIKERNPFAGGQAFARTGPYERLRGRAHFRVDPHAPAQHNIVDLEHAPRDEQGLVHFTADILILKPVTMERGNGRLFYDYGNRANIRALQFFCDAPFSNDPRTMEHAGNGFLFRRGYTVVWCAWQGDVLPGGQRLLLDVPVAKSTQTPLHGAVRTEFIVERDDIECMPLSGFASTHSYPPVSRDPSRATLTRRLDPDGEREKVDPSRWRFARIEQGPGLDGQGMERGLVPSDSNIHMPGGFAAGYIYELIYEARDPLVLGLGYTAVRDFISFLRYELSDTHGQPNPLAEDGVNGIEKAYCWGRSQTGRLIRETIYQGFNADAGGRKVFDGVLNHVAGGGRMILNHRFACGTDAAGQQFEAYDKGADRFPFTYALTRDHLTRAEDSLLKHPHTDPLVIHTQTCTEYWQRHGSLAHTDTRGADVEIPDNVRVYHWSSTQHFADPAPSPAATGPLVHPQNRAQTSMLFRAMLVALDKWASDGMPPPPTRIPSRAEGTLVDANTWRAQFPSIPGACYPQGPARLPLFDHGPRMEQGFRDLVPPRITEQKGYTVLVPLTDADGIDIAGVKAPMIAVPLGTYTGWNIRGRSISGVGAMYWFTGSYLPFPKTRAERQRTGDPRLSIEERYPDVDTFVAQVKTACQNLVSEGFMLEEDVARTLAHAGRWFRPWSATAG